MYFITHSHTRTAPQAEAATVSNDLFLKASTTATANPIAAETMLLVAKNIAGTVIAERTA